MFYYELTAPGTTLKPNIYFNTPNEALWTALQRIIHFAATHHAATLKLLIKDKDTGNVATTLVMQQEPGPEPEPEPIDEIEALELRYRFHSLGDVQ